MELIEKWRGVELYESPDEFILEVLEEGKFLLIGDSMNRLPQGKFTISKENISNQAVAITTSEADDFKYTAFDIFVINDSIEESPIVVNIPDNTDINYAQLFSDSSGRVADGEIIDSSNGKNKNSELEWEEGELIIKNISKLSSYTLDLIDKNNKRVLTLKNIGSEMNEIDLRDFSIDVYVEEYTSIREQNVNVLITNNENSGSIGPVYLDKAVTELNPLKSSKPYNVDARISKSDNLIVKFQDGKQNLMERYQIPAEQDRIVIDSEDIGISVAITIPEHSQYDLDRVEVKQGSPVDKHFTGDNTVKFRTFRKVPIEIRYKGKVVSQIYEVDYGENLEFDLVGYCMSELYVKILSDSNINYLSVGDEEYYVGEGSSSLEVPVDIEDGSVELDVRTERGSYSVSLDKDDIFYKDRLYFS